MKQCTNCSHLQEDGNFCAKCGGATIHVTTEESDTPIQDLVADAPQETADRTPSQTDPVQATGIDVKEVSSQYWNNFMNLMKNPTRAFTQGEDEFIHGLITIVLYAITFGLGIYFILDALYTLEMSGYGFMDDVGIPFLPIVSRIGFYTLMILACTFICIVVFQNIFVKRMSVKQQIAQYGGILSPLIAVHVLAILAGVVSTIGFGLSLLALSLVIATFIFGVIFIYEKISFYQTSSHKVYGSIGVLLANVTILYMWLRIVLLDKLEELLELLRYL